MSTTKADLTAALNILWAVAEVIQGAGEIPSGELYAVLMAKMTIETYQQVIERLKGAGLIREVNHLLIWIGPAKEVK